MTHELLLSDQLPLPPFFDPENGARWGYSPDQEALFERATAWRRERQIAPAGTDRLDLQLLVIDAQKDFCFPQGNLYVGGRSGTGAVEDTKRLASFIYRNLDRITGITATMDTHFAYQIFFASFWLDELGLPLTPHTIIHTDDIRDGRVRPNPDIAWWLCDGDYPWLQRQVAYYTAELERGGKYELYLWPPHCLLGSDGHALAGVIHEARLFHSYVRAAQSLVEIKGGNPLTENYSALGAEVLTRFDGGPLARKNERLIAALLGADVVVIAGQAASHCVKSSIDDLLGEILGRDTALARKVYILADCMSAVTVPDGSGGFLADFTPQAEAALGCYRAAGMHVVASTTPIAAWPEIGGHLARADGPRRRGPSAQAVVRPDEGPLGTPDGGLDTEIAGMGERR